MYQLIHIPKTAGTTFNKYLIRYYNEYFLSIESMYSLAPHSVRCKDVENPVVIIREPYDRFLSVFNYFNNGSELWFNNKTNVSVLDFLNQQFEPKYNYFWYAHTNNQSWYINEKDYKKTIVVVYNKNMQINLINLLSSLGIDIKKNIPELQVSNITSYTKVTLSNKEKNMVYKKYIKDFILYNKIINHKNLFKLVVHGSIS